MNLLGTLVLTVIFFGTSTAPVRQIIAQDTARPSKQIIDHGDEKIVSFEDVPECTEDRSKRRELFKKEKQFYVDRSQIVNELDSLRDKYEPNRTDSEKARISELESKLSKLEADFVAIQSALNKVSSNPGLPDECKIALVKAVRENMVNRADKLPEFLAKLDTTIQLTTKIETSLPELKKTFPNQALIKSIEDDINTIQTSIDILKPFFIDIKKEMDEFIALYNSNPIAAYDKMNKFGQKGDSKFKKAEDAAESMLSALNQLEKSLETLANSVTTPTPTPSPAPTN